MELKPNLNTGIAFDNYDRYVETLTGKNTLHDTVGIAYQDIIEPNAENGASCSNVELEPSSEVDFTVPEKDQCEISSIGVQKSPGYKRRRLYKSSGLVLEPFRKMPRMLSYLLYSSNNPKRHTVPPSSQNARLKDMIWIMSIKFMPQTTPMRVGWNALKSKENGKRQNVWYLPQTNLSPTSYTVVAETLNRGIQIADESNRQSLCFTYDLAIARMAMKIQQEESPKYDRLFINVASFQKEMAFFTRLVHT